MAIELILLDDVQHLGQTGDQVRVKPGFARNYLLPRGLAVEASARNAKALKHSQTMAAARVERKRRAAEDLGTKLSNTELTISVLVGEEDKMFGSVTNRDVEAELVKKGFPVDRRRILLEEPIRTLGVHTVTVRLHLSVTAEVKVWVVAKE